MKKSELKQIIREVIDEASEKETPEAPVTESASSNSRVAGLINKKLLSQFIKTFEELVTDIEKEDMQEYLPEFLKKVMETSKVYKASVDKLDK